MTSSGTDHFVKLGNDCANLFPQRDLTRADVAETVGGTRDPLKRTLGAFKSIGKEWVVHRPIA
jgi:hypothetical protein